jgi:hypothetical protein
LWWFTTHSRASIPASVQYAFSIGSFSDSTATASKYHARKSPKTQADHYRNQAIPARHVERAAICRSLMIGNHLLNRDHCGNVMFRKSLILAYGIVYYLLLFAVFNYAILFIGNIPVSPSLDGPESEILVSTAG